MKHFFVNKFTDLHHLSYEVTRFEKAKTLRILAKTNAHEDTYYYEAVEVLSQGVHV